MPNYESTAVFKADISSLKKEMQAASRAAKLADAEFKAATAGMDNWAASADGLEAKLTQLDKKLASQKTRYEQQKQVVEAAEKAFGKNSAAADRERLALLNMESAMKRTEAEIRKYSADLDEINKASDEAAEGTKKYESASEELTDTIEKQEKELDKLKQAYKDALLDDNAESAEQYADEIKSASKELADNKKKMQEAEKAADALDESLEDVGEGSGKATDGFTVMKGALANLAAQGVDLAVDALKKMATETVRAGSEFDAAMSKVSALSGASGSDLEKLSSKAKELGSNTRFSATEVAQGFQYMSLAGWDANTSLSAIEGVVNLAASAEMDLAEASDMVTDYLSAFGMEASEASKMADMLAYAQANSNTSARQLGEAYGNSAAGLHAAGQDIETTTALLEAMANQGLKGSEAGTALNGIMSQITQKMKNGAIQIGNTSVAVQDQYGNFRDLVDILDDVETATDGMGSAEKSAALAAVFNRSSLKGLNLILNEGVDNVEDYRDALEGSTGAAEDMANVMQDNLQGDVTEMNSALEGLGIAAYSYIDGPLRSVVQGVTGFIGKLTDDITPAENMLKSFSEEVSASVKATQDTISQAKETVNTAEADAAKLETYKQILMESNGAADEFSKYQVEQIVKELSDQIPELAAAWDDETKSLKLSNEEISKYIDEAAEMARVTAYQKAAQESIEALTQAQINKMKADTAAKHATEDYNAALKKGRELNDGTIRVTGEVADAYAAATKAQRDADDALTDAQEEVDLITEALSGMDTSLTDVADSEEEVEESSDDMGDTLEDTGEIADDTAQKLQEAADAMYKSVRDSMDGAITAFEEFNGGEKITAAEIKKNLESQIAGIQNWADNMKKLGALAGNGMSQEFYDYLVEMGPSGANLVQELVDTLEEDEGEFREISDLYAEAMDLKNHEADLIAGATSAGKAAADAAADGMEGEKGFLERNVEKLMNTADKTMRDEIPRAGIAGVDIGAALASGVVSKEQENKSAASTLVAGVASEFSKGPAEAESKGTSTGGKYASGISSQKDETSSAASGLVSAATNALGSSTAVSKAQSAGDNVGRGFYNKIKSWWDKAKALMKDDGGGGSRTNPGPNQAGGAVRNPNGNAGTNYAYQQGADFFKAYIAGIASQEGKLEETARALSEGVFNIMTTAAGAGAGAVADNAISLFSDGVSKKLDYFKRRMEYENDRKLDEIDKSINKLEGNRDKAKEKVDKTESDLKDVKKQLKQAKEDQKELTKLNKEIDKNKTARLAAEVKYNKDLEKLNKQRESESRKKNNKTEINRITREIESLQKSWEREDKAYAEKIKKDEATAKKLAKSAAKIQSLERDKSILSSALKGAKAQVEDWETLIKKESQYKERYEAASAEMIRGFENALDQYEQSANALIDSTINGITERYNERYDELIGKQNELINKLKSAGELFNISGAGVMTVNDIEEQTRAINDYAGKLAKIKNKVSAELFDEIATFDMKEGSAFMDRLLGMSDADLRKYNEAYMKKLEAAQAAGDMIYKSDIDKAAEDYQNELDKAFKDLPEQLKEIGKQAMQGFVEGLAGDTDYMDKNIQKLINSMIDQFKTTLDIHSPSRLMYQMGEYTIEGFGNGLESVRKRIQNEAEKIAGIVSAPFEGIGDLSGYGSIGQAAGMSVVNNYNLVQNNTSPKALTALDTYQARRQQISLIKAFT